MGLFQQRVARSLGLLAILALTGAALYLSPVRLRLRVTLLAPPRWSVDDARWALRNTKRHRDGILALQRIGSTEAAQCLIEMTEHKEAYIRRRAVEILGQWKWTPAFERIINCLHDAESDVVVSAAWALSELGDRRAVPHLCNLLAPGRVFVVNALGRLRDPFAIPRLERLAAADPSAVTQIEVTTALKLIRDPAAQAPNVAPPSQR